MWVMHSHPECPAEQSEDGRIEGHKSYLNKLINRVVY